MKKLAFIGFKNHKLPFIFEAAQAEGFDLVFVHDGGESAPENLPAISAIWKLPLFSNPEAALRDFAAGYQKYGIGGVMTVREEAVIWTARAAACMGRPGISVSAAQRARDKYAMRQAFALAGLRVPGFVQVRQPDAWAQAAALGFPLVVKPISGVSSAGVMLARSAQELREWVQAVWQLQARDLARFYDPAATAGLVVEQYLPGPEFVAECFVDAAGIHILAIGEKGQPQGPWFEETVYRQRMDMDSPLLRQIAEAARAGVRAVGIAMGAAHVELRLDAQDRPHVIELGARIGGSGVSHFIVEQGCGVSFSGLCMRAALGLPTPALPATLVPQKVAANYIIPLRGHGRFAGFSGMHKVAAHPATARVIPFFAPGHSVPPPPAFGGYPGFVFSTHPALPDATAYHQWLDEALGTCWQAA